MRGDLSGSPSEWSVEMDYLVVALWPYLLVAGLIGLMVGWYSCRGPEGHED